MQPVVSISKCKASAEQWENLGKVFKLIRFEGRAVLALEDDDVAVVPKIPLSWESASSSSSEVCTTLVVAGSAQVADSVAFEWKPVDLSCLESSGEEEERDQEEEEEDNTFQLEGDEEEEEEKPFGEAAKAFAIADTPFVWKAPVMELATPPSGEAAKAFAIDDDVDEVP